MTREEELDWLCRLRSEIYVYMPKEWLIPMNGALDMAIKALEQEFCGDVINRQADNLCSSCTNIGCEFQSGIVRTKCAFYMPPHIEPDNCGNYVVMQPINPQEPKTIQEKQAESEKYQKAFDDGYENGYAQARFDYEQEPKTGHKVYGDLLGGLYCSECMTCVNEYFNYCPHCGAKMIEPQKSDN